MADIVTGCLKTKKMWQLRFYHLTLNSSYVSSFFDSVALVSSLVF